MTVDRDLTPADAVVALHSFPRRFRAVLERPGDDDRPDPDELGRRFGPDGSSAAEHLLAADAVLALVEESVRRRTGSEALHPGLGDLASVAIDDDTSPVPTILDRFEATATAAATRIDSVPNDDWATTVPVAGQAEPVGLLVVVQDAIGVVADHLRAAQRVIDAVV